MGSYARKKTVKRVRRKEREERKSTLSPRFLSCLLEVREFLIICHFGDGGLQPSNLVKVKYISTALCLEIPLLM